MPSTAQISASSTIKSEATPAHSTPFDLIPANPDRKYPLGGDVLYFNREQSHAWIEKTGDLKTYHLTWLNGLQAGESKKVGQDTLDYLYETDAISVSATNVNDPSNAWWLLDATVSNLPNPKTGPVKTISTNDLTLIRDRYREGVRAFLNHPLVDHDLGLKKNRGWKACFTAAYRGRRVAVALLRKPDARMLNDSNVITLTRYAAHPRRPPNTASWLLARARKWAELEAYDELRTYAGVSNDNKGTIYQATGFRLDDTEQAKGDGWQNRDGRASWNDYTRRRYIYPLEEIIKPDPDLYWDQQTTLTSYTSANKSPEPNETLIARFDHAKNWATTKYEDLAEPNQPTINFDNITAIFGTIDDSGITSLFPIACNKRKAIAKIETIAINSEKHDYPANVGSKVAGKIRQWAELEGLDSLKCTAQTPTAMEICKQAQIPINTTESQKQKKKLLAQ